MTAAEKDGKVIAILQSNYLPWKGYFDLMNAADEFVIFDEVQYTRRDWRNRNKIVINGELKWLTIPVEVKHNYNSPIFEIEIADTKWADKHFSSICHGYSKAPFYNQYRDLLRETYEAASELFLLSDVNRLFLSRLAPLIGVDTPLCAAETAPRSVDDPCERLIEICLYRGAAWYLSGPAARSYIAPEKFSAAGVRLAYANYIGYPTYDQKRAEFEHGVSVVDTLMRIGPEAGTHLKSRNGWRGFVDIEPASH